MHKLSRTVNIYNLSTFLFFCILLAMNAFTNTGLLVVAWYSLGCLCFALGAFLQIRKISADIVVFCVVCILTSLLCYKINQNLTITQYIYLMMCPIIGLLFIDPRVHTNTFKYIVLLYSFYIFISFLKGGINAQVFQTSSTNFVSVFLLYPTVIYYVKIENENRNIPVYPIAIVWVLSIFARGRGGILTTTFFLFWIILRAYKEHLKSQKNRILIGVALAVILVIAIMSMISTSDIWLKWDAFEYFNGRGLQSRSRFEIWGEYLEAMRRNQDYIIYGAPFSDLKLQVTEYFGNMHNSFINIHVYNGLAMLIITVFYLLRACISGIREHRTIYLACLITFCMRSFTDNVFWGAYGTPVFFALLFFPYDRDQNKITFMNRLKWSILHGRTGIKVR